MTQTLKKTKVNLKVIKHIVENDHKAYRASSCLTLLQADILSLPELKEIYMGLAAHSESNTPLDMLIKQIEFNLERWNFLMEQVYEVDDVYDLHIQEDNFFKSKYPSDETFRYSFIENALVDLFLPFKYIPKKDWSIYTEKELINYYLGYEQKEGKEVDTKKPVALIRVEKMNDWVVEYEKSFKEMLEINRLSLSTVQKQHQLSELENED